MTQTRPGALVLFAINLLSLGRFGSVRKDVLAQLSKLEPGDPRRPAAVELVTSNFDKFSDNGEVRWCGYGSGNGTIRPSEAKPSQTKPKLYKYISTRQVFCNKRHSLSHLVQSGEEPNPLDYANYYLSLCSCFKTCNSYQDGR